MRQRGDSVHGPSQASTFQDAVTCAREREVWSSGHATTRLKMGPYGITASDADERGPSIYIQCACDNHGRASGKRSYV